MKFRILVLLTLFASWLGYHADDQNIEDSLFLQANEAIANQKYTKAIQRYHHYLPMIHKVPIFTSIWEMPIFKPNSLALPSTITKLTLSTQTIEIYKLTYY